MFRNIGISIGEYDQIGIGNRSVQLLTVGVVERGACLHYARALDCMG